MTRKDIILKGETQLDYLYAQMIKCDSELGKAGWAKSGVDQLEMLSYLLDEKYDKYSEWFDKFSQYV